MDNEGKLTRDEQEKLRVWLQDKVKNHACPVCNNTKWGLGAHVLRGVIEKPGTISIGGPSYPMAFIVCKNCHHVRTFMALPIGLGIRVDDTIDNEPAAERPGNG